MLGGITGCGCSVSPSFSWGCVGEVGCSIAMLLGVNFRQGRVRRVLLFYQVQFNDQARCSFAKKRPLKMPQREVCTVPYVGTASCRRREEEQEKAPCDEGRRRKMDEETLLRRLLDLAKLRHLCVSSLTSLTLGTNNSSKHNAPRSF